LCSSRSRADGPHTADCATVWLAGIRAALRTPRLCPRPPDRCRDFAGAGRSQGPAVAEQPTRRPQAVAPFTVTCRGDRIARAWRTFRSLHLVAVVSAGPLRRVTHWREGPGLTGLAAPARAGRPSAEARAREAGPPTGLPLRPLRAVKPGHPRPLTAPPLCDRPLSRRGAKRCPVRTGTPQACP
jgi:hypothetical protein